MALRGRVVSRARETLAGMFLLCPGDTERGSRCHPLLALARTVIRTRRRSGYSIAYSDGVAVGEEARAWRGPGGPSPAERGGRVCSEKSENSKIPRRQSGASRRARWLATARTAVNPQQMGCRWGCERRAPLPVSPRARLVVRVVARASSSSRRVRERSRVPGKSSG